MNRIVLCAAVLFAAIIAEAAPKPEVGPRINFRVSIDSSGAPELAEWCEKSLRPEMEKWYVEFCRRGKYSEEAFWPSATGKTLDELEKEWQASSPPPKPKKKRVVVKKGKK